MALAERQWQVRDLVMGPGTAYRVLSSTNPFTINVRADQSEPRAWNHGSWSGAEWAEQRVVPLRILTDTADVAAWVAAHQSLAAAFAPVGDATGQVELRFALGGREYLLLGRPRMVEPETDLIGVGRSFARCAFVAQDPRIYAGAESSASTGLTQTAGGLLVPFLVPFTVGGTLTGGAVTLLNEGTTDAPLTVRIDGPVDQPRLVIQAPDGSTSTLLVEVTLAAGQWLDVDTMAKTALLNGLPTSNQFGRAVWGWEQFPLAPGTSTLRFFADSFEASALVTPAWRSAWW